MCNDFGHSVIVCWLLLHISRMEAFIVRALCRCTLPVNLATVEFWDAGPDGRFLASCPVWISVFEVSLNMY